MTMRTWTTLLLILLGQAWAAPYAIISKTELPETSRNQYTLIMLDENRYSVSHEYSLGELAGTPDGFVSANGEKVWLEIPRKGKNSWIVSAIETATGDEWLRMSIGRRTRSGKYATHFLHETADGTLWILVYGQEGWELVKHQPGKAQSTIALGRRQPRVEVLGSNRIIVIQDKDPRSSTTLKLIDPDSGRVLFDETIQNNIEFDYLPTNQDRQLVILETSSVELELPPRERRRQWVESGRLRILELADGQISSDVRLGAWSAMVGLPGQAGFVVANTRLGSEEGGITVWSAEADGLRSLASDSQSCVLTQVLLSAAGDVGAAVCWKPNRMFVFRTGQESSHAWVNTRIRAESGLFTGEDRLFIRERRGSEVALVDLSIPAFVTKEGTGRPDVKAALFLVQAGLAAASTLLVGFPALGNFYADTETHMLVSDGALFVLNEGTRDVTVLDKGDLGNERYIAVGDANVALWKEDESELIFAIGPKEVRMISTVDERVVDHREGGCFLGIDPEAKLLFYGSESGLEIIETVGGTSRARLPDLKHVARVLVPDTELRQGNPDCG